MDPKQSAWEPRHRVFLLFLVLSAAALVAWLVVGCLPSQTTLPP